MDKAEVEVIKSLPPLRTVRDIKSFLDHAGFYQRFINDFLKISRPLCLLLQKDKDFVFDEECLVAFETLKETLTSTLVIAPPVWDLPFELMCDASDYAVGTVWGRGLARTHMLYITHPGL